MLWGAPRIHGELLKLGIEISQATVGRWMPWRPKVPSPTWRTFLRNHLPDIAAIDMFVVATATFRLLYALIVLSLDRRRVVHFEVTANWLSRQMTEAFPWDTAPRYVLRDRDTSYGPAFRHRVRAMGTTEVITAPRSPWQNPYAERLIGSIRRECQKKWFRRLAAAFAVRTLWPPAARSLQALDREAELLEHSYCSFRMPSVLATIATTLRNERPNLRRNIARDLSAEIDTRFLPNWQIIRVIGLDGRWNYSKSHLPSLAWNR